jgi:mono/diheme cytochrome c family protein
MKVKAAFAVGALALAATFGGASAADPPPYKVGDGNKVAKSTLAGWKVWRAAACERCHGPNQEGMVGPSLVESLKTSTKEQFKKAVLTGVPEKGMPNFDGSPQVRDGIDNLYVYLKGRSDGAIRSGRLEELQQYTSADDTRGTKGN